MMEKNFSTVCNVFFGLASKQVALLPHGTSEIKDLIVSD